MKLVEDTLGVDVDTFLARPLFCFLSTGTEEGPRVSPLWYDWGGHHLWIVADPVTKSYPERIERDPRTAVAVVDFDAERGLVQHVGMRGRASVEPFDPERATAVFSRYMGPRERWDDRFLGVFDTQERYRLVRFDPETVVARDQSYAPT